MTGLRAPVAIDAALIEAWALSYLARYASSAANLRHVLLRRARRLLGADRDALRAVDALIEGLVTRYEAAQLLDDRAYAAARARRDLVRGRSMSRIAAGLAAKGVGATEAAAAIAALRDGATDPDLIAAVAFARRRRLGPFRAQARERDHELAAFARAGFAPPIAEAVLACADPTAVEAMLAGNR